MTESLNSEVSALTLGQQLKTAREALNLSISDVAQKTNLKKSHIESLENDIFILKNVAPTFVRGYVRNYVKFLRLPESLISSVNYGEVTIPKDIVKMPPVKSSPKSQGRSLKYLTILVLFAALGMTLLWWWQGYQQEQENREQLVNSTPVVVETNNTSATEASNQVTIPVQQPIQAESETPAKEVAPVVSEPALTEKVEPTQPETTVAPVEESKPAQSEAANVLQQPVADTGAVLPEQPATISNDELRIEIIGEQSWITVRGGAKGQRLAEKLYRNGETLSFNENEQYRLTIGAPGNVKIYYKGQEVPLKVDGSVAKIRLPQQ